MALFFGRIVTVTVDALRVTGLRTSFKVEKTLTKHPNTLDVTIYNLAETSRRKIQKKGARVELIAGYEGNVETLFVGDATIINHQRVGADWITRLQSGDGVTALRTTRVNESFAPGTSVGDVIKKIADKTGLALGNVADEVAKGNVRNALTEFSKGFVSSGLAGDELDKIAKNIGREFSVQDGAIQLSQPDQAVGNAVVLLSPTSGLIGSPEYAEVSAGAGGATGTKKTILKVKSLIQQKLLPGRRVSLFSNAVNGFFRVEKVTFTGDTHAEPWYAELELKAI